MRKLKTPAGLAACACVLLLLAAAHAQAKVWRRVVPLLTTRAQVERRLGKPSGGYYEFRDERAFVHYANGRGCDGRNRWNVPRDTVIRVVVTPKVEMRLSSLRLDPRKFEKSTDPGLTSRALYTDKAAGITYEVFEGGGEDNGRVMQIEFIPAARDGARVRCPASP